MRKPTCSLCSAPTSPNASDLCERHMVLGGVVGRLAAAWETSGRILLLADVNERMFSFNERLATTDEIDFFLRALGKPGCANVQFSVASSHFMSQPPAFYGVVIQNAQGFGWHILDIKGFIWSFCQQQNSELTDHRATVVWDVDASVWYWKTTYPRLAGAIWGTATSMGQAMQMTLGGGQAPETPILGE